MTDDVIPHPLYRVTLDFNRPLDGDTATEIGNYLEELGVSVFMRNREATDGDLWDVSLTTYGAPDTDAVFACLQSYAADKGIDALITPDKIAVEKLPETDWLRHVHENFPPIETGRFFIYGSHYEGLVPDSKVPLCIDAATAFGSGEHETTKGCLMAFEALAENGGTFQNALDMGCGSGILAIALTKIWPGIRATAVDIDPESIVVTNRHADMNGAIIAAEAGDGYQSPIVDDNGPYDIIAANILAGPLIAMAQDLDRVLKPGGVCVLSGLLGRQENDVIEAHLRCGLLLQNSIKLGEWRALVFEKKALHTGF